MNENLNGAVKKLTAILLCFISAQLGLVLVLNGFVDGLGAELAADLPQIRLVMLAVLLFSSVLTDGFFVARILRLRSLKNAEILLCSVEDIVIAARRSDGSKKYKAHLLLKDAETNKLYLAVGKYDLSWYTSMYSRGGDGSVGMKIFKKDRSCVMPGDRVKLLVRRCVQLQFDRQKERVRIGDKAYSLRLQDRRYGPDVFSRVTFVEAAADID